MKETECRVIMKVIDIGAYSALGTEIPIYIYRHHN